MTVSVTVDVVRTVVEVETVSVTVTGGAATDGVPAAVQATVRAEANTASTRTAPRRNILLTR